MDQKTGIRVTTLDVARSEGTAGEGRLWVSGLPSTSEKTHESPSLHPRPVDGRRDLYRTRLRRSAVGLPPLGECGLHVHRGPPRGRPPRGDGSPGACPDDLG